LVVVPSSTCVSRGKRRLDGGGHPVQPIIGERRRHHLEPDRHPVFVGKTARNRDGRVAREVGRDRAQVGEVHRHRIAGALAETEGGGRRHRGDQHVDLAERRLEVLNDERPHLLRLAVVGVVVPA
jgi:hypothetical protein